jgi:Uma2 family endonuclease
MSTPVPSRRTPAGAQHGLVCANIVFELKLYLSENPVGVCFGAGTGFVTHMDPLSIVSVDAAVVRSERIGNDAIGAGAFVGAPDLAVIVVSPDDQFDVVEADTQRLITAGASHVWILRPRVRMVTVHRPNNEMAVLGEPEALLAEDVLPGFKVLVRRVFEGVV